jgi:16S rRNA (guanine527-N7)-methyltransferase
MKRKPARSLLLEGAGNLGLSIPPGQADQLMVYLDLLKRWNRRMNLTALTDDSAIIEKHFLDSLMGGAEMGSGGPVRLIDIGTGAGFPSLPLRILSPWISVTLVESSRKKAAFLLNLCGVLGLQGVRVLPERIEALQEHPDHAFAYERVTARAFAKPQMTLRAAIPFLAPHGRVLLYLSPTGASELEPPADWSTHRTDYVLPFSNSKRSLVVLTRPE